MRHYDYGDKWGNYTIGITMAMTLFAAFPMTTFAEPMQLRHESMTEKETIDDFSYLKRAYWTLCVFMSNRGIGWSYEVRCSVYLSI